MPEELTATLVVSRSNSYCGHCNKPTLPSKTHHTDISGWAPRPGEGCGARFVDIRSDTRVVTAERLREMRPDLPVRDGEEPGRECPGCGAPADETGTSIPEHRPGSPCTVDYHAV